ncbi:hypothetical protein DIPPA_70213 [Diplonema papillatum]|nr:hypothetical protein DIPPA_70213 [Diplonema papillatum]
MGTVLRAGRGAARVIGVKYGTPLNADAVWDVLENSERRPKRVLMESFCCPSREVVTGGRVAYEEEFDEDAMAHVMASSADPSVRARWSGELVAVVAAMRHGIPVHFCDRLHGVSFNRYLHRSSKEDLFLDLLKAVDRVAKVEDAEMMFSRAVPELWEERHKVATTLIRRAAAELREGEEVVAVVGDWHRQEIEKLWDTDADLDELLVDYPPDPVLSDIDLDKRAAMAALLATTMAYPPQLVLVPGDLAEENRERAGRTYNSYRTLFRRRFHEHRAGWQEHEEVATKEDVAKRLAERASGATLGLLALPRIVNSSRMMLDAAASGAGAS